MVKVRLLLVDQNDDFLDGLSAWLADSPAIQVTGVAHSASEAIERVGRLSPDMVLMDMALPDMSGLEAVRRIKSRPGAPLVILMTFHDSISIRTEARASGADGCLSKPEITKEFFLVAETLLRARLRRDSAAGQADPARGAPHPPPKETGE